MELLQQGELLRMCSESVMKEKVKLYGDVIQAHLDTLNMGKGSQSKQIALINRMQSIRIRMVVFAPDVVVKQFFTWIAIASVNSVPEETVKSFAQLMLEIRRDLVGDTSLGIEDMADGIL
jgi:hypothetical protein